MRILKAVIFYTFAVILGLLYLVWPNGYRRFRAWSKDQVAKGVEKLEKYDERIQELKAQRTTTKKDW